MKLAAQLVFFLVALGGLLAGMSAAKQHPPLGGVLIFFGIATLPMAIAWALIDN